MDIKKKRELLEAWENRHPEMGVISFRCSATDETFLATATDIPAKFNRIRFQLSAGELSQQAVTGTLGAIWRGRL